MAALPQAIREAWENREGPIVLTTVDNDGTPNSIYASCVRQVGDDTFVVADNFFCKTRANILSGTTGSLLFITKEGKSFQVKGPVEYFTEGPVFENMKEWNPERLPGHAAAALKVESAYAGANELS